LLLVAAAGMGGSSPVAHATLTAPTLRLAAVEAESGGTGGAMLRVTGDFPYDDLVQGEYPLQLFIRQMGDGTRFICFSFRWGPMEGDHPSVEKGLTPKEALALGEIARPSEDARFLELAPGRMDVQLPADWPAGEAEAQLFVVYVGTPLFSNPIPFVVEEASP
jgi:hypothetical protein